MPNVRILIVDDSQLFRLALVALLRAEASFEVVGQAADGLSGVTLADDLTPDVILMDVRMPGEIDGVEATRRIISTRPETRVVGFSSENGHREAMLDAGATDFVGKDHASDLIDRIKAAVAIKSPS